MGQHISNVFELFTKKNERKWNQEEEEETSTWKCRAKILISNSNHFQEPTENECEEVRWMVRESREPCASLWKSQWDFESSSHLFGCSRNMGLFFLSLFCKCGRFFHFFRWLLFCAVLCCIVLYCISSLSIPVHSARCWKFQGLFFTSRPKMEECNFKQYAFVERKCYRCTKKAREQSNLCVMASNIKEIHTYTPVERERDKFHIIFGPLKQRPNFSNYVYKWY